MWLKYWLADSDKVVAMIWNTKRAQGNENKQNGVLELCFGK